MNSHVTKQLSATVPVILLQFRPSESSFACLSSLTVLAPTFRRLAHLHPRVHRQFVMDKNCRVVEWSAFIDEALLSLSVCRER